MSIKIYTNVSCVNVSLFVVVLKVAYRPVANMSCYSLGAYTYVLQNRKRLSAIKKKVHGKSCRIFRTFLGALKQVTCGRVNEPFQRFCQRAYYTYNIQRPTFERTS